MKYVCSRIDQILIELGVRRIRLSNEEKIGRAPYPLLRLKALHDCLLPAHVPEIPLHFLMAC
jgi:hypothetical protein